jgi:hypothetical protein
MMSDPSPWHTIGELYFNIKILQDKLKVESSDAGERRLEGYEKIRTVGKGMEHGCILQNTLPFIVINNGLNLL